MNTFEKELTSLINKHSIENISDTPDYVISSFLISCLKSYNRAIIDKKTHENRN